MKTPQEYREKVLQEKVITLPSGLECVIRSVPTLRILELNQQADKAGIALDKYMTSNFAEALNTVIPSSVVSPRILPVRVEGDTSFDEDALYLDELVIGDLNSLFKEIMTISGIKQDEIEKYESFPVNR